MIKKLLVANRGEIAVRIMRTAQRMGIPTVGIYSEIDNSSLHVAMADEAFCLGKSELADTYLNVEKIIHIALHTGCDMLHPGYGFLSENPRLVAACHEAGIRFVGPGAQVMDVMGDKVKARQFVASLGLPVTLGATGTAEQIMQKAHQLRFPLLVKAAGGGGGKGMRIVRELAQLADALEDTSREAANYFANGTVYVEQYLEKPRHIEIQILGDAHGNVVHLFERECSIQRRYQKIVEESPSPTLDAGLRQKMGDAAVNIGKAIAYEGAGTIEFLVDGDLSFYFLEMNTRIQVEHPVTEMTTGVDIVEEQLYIATGVPLRMQQSHLAQHGHAIECRVYAEDPSRGFIPSPGPLSLYSKPLGKGIRVDDALAKPFQVSSFFDPMIAKLIVHDADRPSAIWKMQQALGHYGIQGISNNISFLKAVMQDEAYKLNHVSTQYCNDRLPSLLAHTGAEKEKISAAVILAAALAFRFANPSARPDSIWHALGYWRISGLIALALDEQDFDCRVLPQADHAFNFRCQGDEHRVNYRLDHAAHILHLQVDGSQYSMFVSCPGPDITLVSMQALSWQIKVRDVPMRQPDFAATYAHGANQGGNLCAPMPGKVIKVLAKAGQKVSKGDTVMIVEAMKMENNLCSPFDAEVKNVNAEAGMLVDSTTVLIELEKI